MSWKSRTFLPTLRTLCPSKSPRSNTIKLRLDLRLWPKQHQSQPWQCHKHLFKNLYSRRVKCRCMEHRRSPRVPVLDSSRMIGRRVVQLFNRNLCLLSSSNSFRCSCNNSNNNNSSSSSSSKSSSSSINSSNSSNNNSSNNNFRHS